MELKRENGVMWEIKYPSVQNINSLPNQQIQL